jgi:A/G-specific adenine glycosylase
MARPLKPASPADRALTRDLIAWFVANARRLPWRDHPLGAPRDPYRVLVSEVMLQQTQASRVAERFDRFVGRFPDVHALAGAPEADVLAEWSGLGYYRRARLLHAAARAVVADHAGIFPDRAEVLAALPGVGRYTAGAVASLAFHRPEPAVDANVSRVVLRLEGLALPAAAPEAAKAARLRAEALHRAAPRRRGAAALLNEALIELGALVCTPRAPRCAECPLAPGCEARKRGEQHRIPTPARAVERPLRHFASVLIADARGRLAVTRRPDTGLWAGLFQAPTIERAEGPVRPEALRRAFGLARGRGALRRVDAFAFKTTHRDCRFVVYRAAAPDPAPEGWRFLTPGRIAELALSSPQRRILLGGGRGAG